jgi:hypothetical protein
MKMMEGMGQIFARRSTELGTGGRDWKDAELELTRDGGRQLNNMVAGCWPPLALAPVTTHHTTLVARKREAERRSNAGTQAGSWPLFSSLSNAQCCLLHGSMKLEGHVNNPTNEPNYDHLTILKY